MELFGKRRTPFACTMVGQFLLDATIGCAVSFGAPLPHPSIITEHTPELDPNDWQMYKGDTRDFDPPNLKDVHFYVYEAYLEKHGLA